MNRMILAGRWSTFTILLVVSLVAATGFTPGDDQEGNRNIKVWAHLSRQSYKPGDAGELTITFAPSEGYHVQASPAVTISIADKKILTLKGSPTQSVDNSSGYLSTTSPVRQGFYVPSSTPPGFHVVKGFVQYSYTSDEEGRTRSVRQPISLSFTLTQ